MPGGAMGAAADLVTPIAYGLFVRLAAAGGIEVMLWDFDNQTPRCGIGESVVCDVRGAGEGGVSGGMGAVA